MKKTLITAGAALAVAGSAQAAVYTFQYTGIVDSAYLDNLPGDLDISAGDTISGTFVVDTSAVSQIVGGNDLPESQYAVRIFSTPQAATLRFDRVGFNYSAPVYLTTVTDSRVSSGRDRVVIEAGSYFGGGGGSGDLNVLALEFNAPYDTIASTSVPELAFTKFRDADIYFQMHSDSNGRSWSLNTNSHLTSISLVSAVPEPGTYAMLLAGLGLLGWRARARR